jgi:hypothetical protein
LVCTIFGKALAGFTRRGSIEAFFIAAFGDRERERVAETNMQSFTPRNMVCCNLYSKISTVYM